MSQFYARQLSEALHKKGGDFHGGEIIQSLIGRLENIPCRNKRGQITPMQVARCIEEALGAARQMMIVIVGEATSQDFVAKLERISGAAQDC